MTLPHPTVTDVTNDPGYDALKHHVIGATGLAYYMDKDVDFAAQIARRFTALRVKDCHTYLARLVDGHDGETELDVLTASLTIGETFFFRHQEFFDALRSVVLPELIDRNRQQRRLRIWSAGCAIGAEPYSLAILLRREFGAQLVDWDVSIVGTDINREFLAHAGRGEFGEWSLRSMPDGLKTSCFNRTGQVWAIKDEYRRGVLFQYHNLVQHPFPSLVNGLSAFDLILCRNVMIYFEPAIVRQLVGQFHESLVEGGWFVVGPAEPNVGLFRAFQTVSLPDAILYRKGPQSPPVLCNAPNVTASALPATRSVEMLPGAITTLAKTVPQSAAGHRRKPGAGRHHPSCQPVTQPRTTLAEVRGHLNRGESDAADACCRKLLAADRLNPMAHFYHALAAEQQGRHAEAEQALRRAIYLDRDFVLAHYQLGLRLQRDRDARAAQRCFRNVLVLLHRRDKAATFADADGLTVGALEQLTEMHLEVLNRA